MNRLYPEANTILAKDTAKSSHIGKVEVALYHR